MEGFGKLLIIAGLVLTAAGALIWSGFGKGWLGRLPGDIHVERGGWGLSFPIVTCLLISVVLTILLNIFRR